MRKKTGVHLTVTTEALSLSRWLSLRSPFRTHFSSLPTLRCLSVKMTARRSWSAGSAARCWRRVCFGNAGGGGSSSPARRSGRGSRVRRRVAIGKGWCCAVFLVHLEDDFFESWLDGSLFLFESFRFSVISFHGFLVWIFEILDFIGVFFLCVKWSSIQQCLIQLYMNCCVWVFGEREIRIVIEIWRLDAPIHMKSIILHRSRW